MDQKLPDNLSRKSNHRRDEGTKEAFKKLTACVVTAGKYAAGKQYTVVRTQKTDGSILTKIDTELDLLLTDKIRKYFPGSGIISEENPETATSSEAEGGSGANGWTFTLDPIDGTDSFSQGMPGWCIAVGILNSAMEPAGAIIYAPRWGTEKNNGNLLTLIPGGELQLNGVNLDPRDLDLDPPGQLVAGSAIHQSFDFSSYEGKLRNTGSAALGIISPLLHSDVKGAIITPCYIWDFAPAHAAVRKAGMDLEYFSETKIDYKILADRRRTPEHLVAGSNDTRKFIREHFKLKGIKN